jgi:charged multivesicular body protein 4
MMASFMSYFSGRRDPKQSARDAIVTLRQHLQMIEKKEEHLTNKVEIELKKAKANAVSNKPGERAELLSTHVCSSCFGQRLLRRCVGRRHSRQS